MKLFTLLALLVLGAVATFAQERAIERSEFDAAVEGSDAHRIKWAGRPYRMTVNTTSRALNRPQTDYAAKMVFEFGTARTMHSTTTSTFGGVRTIRETLFVGDTSYERENGGGWIAKRRPAPGSGITSEADAAPDAVDDQDTSYFWVGKELINGETATVFRKVEKSRDVDAASGNRSKFVRTSVYWIVDGLQRKSELRSHTESAKAVTNNFISTEWKLDPTITIIAPPVATPKVDSPD